MTTQEWVSIHIFHHGDLDTLIVDLVMPLIDELRAEGLARDGFFLRYWDGGPHLRLRIQVTGDPGDAEIVRAAAGGRARAYVLNHPSPLSLDSAAYARQAAWLGRREGVHPMPLQPPDTVSVIGYVPETTRYGSGGALAAVETHFGHSSRLAAELISAGATRAHRQTAVSMNLLVAWALNGAAAQPPALAIPAIARLRRSASAQLDRSVRDPGRPTERGVSDNARAEAAVDHCRRLIPSVVSLAAVARTTTSSGSFARWARSLATTLDAVAADPHRPERSDHIADLAVHLFANRLGVGIDVEGELRGIAARAVLHTDHPTMAGSAATRDIYHRTPRRVPDRSPDDTVDRKADDGVA